MIWSQIFLVNLFPIFLSSNSCQTPIFRPLFTCPVCLFDLIHVYVRTFSNALPLNSSNSSSSRSCATPYEKPSLISFLLSKSQLSPFSYTSSVMFISFRDISRAQGLRAQPVNRTGSEPQLLCFLAVLPEPSHLPSLSHSLCSFVLLENEAASGCEGWIN